MDLEKKIYPKHCVELIETCPECYSAKLHFDERKAELVCKTCGFVIQEQVPIIEAVTGCKTQKAFIHKTTNKLAIILNGMIKTNIERAMTPFFIDIKRVELTKYEQAEVLRICRQAVEKKITMRIPKIKILCAAIYIIAKQNGVPCFFDDLERIYSVRKVDILRAYRKLCRILKVKIKPNEHAVSNYITRFVDDLRMAHLGNPANDISKNTKVENPIMSAAASIYLAAQNMNVKLAAKDICRVAHISEMGLMDNVKKLV